MTSPFTQKTEARDYLFLPSNPAANGRLHLGHISGPYLAADLLARHRLRQGHRVATIFGIDAYNSYVARRADLEGTAPPDVASSNYDLILEDLRALSIRHDLFTNPLAEEWSERYRAKHVEILGQLEERGALELFTEQAAYSEKDKAFIPDYAISGTCPECEAGMGGFVCEGCGGYFFPDEILDQVTADGEPVTFRAIDHGCLSLDTVSLSLEDFAAYDFAPPVSQVIDRHLRNRNGWFKLSQHFDWGLRVKLAGAERTVVSYMTEYLYNLMHGDLYAEMTGRRSNPYHPDSGVTIICSFGIDNVIAQAFGKVMMSRALGDLKADDGFLVNHFLNLEGQKFSTSRRHVIWASDIVAKTPASSDGVRLYLASIAPSEPGRNFDLQAFTRLQNDCLVAILNPALERCTAALANDVAIEPDPEAIDALAASFLRQEAALRDQGVDAAKVAEPILGWIERAPGPSVDPRTAYWWLKGLSLLAYPIMPDLCTALWRGLASGDTPAVRDFVVDIDLSRGFGPLEPFNVVSEASLAPCLPETLRKS